MRIFHWKPLTIQEILLIFTIFVALFGERVWRWFDKKNKQKKIKQILLVPLEQLKQDLLKIRRMNISGNVSRPNNKKILLNQIDFDKITNSFFLFTDVMIPYCDYLNFPKESKTIEFFTHYNQNIETLKSLRYRNGQGSLPLGTLNDLLERLELCIKELT